MRQFFTVVFGGLLAIVAGIGIAYGGSRAWIAVKPHLPSFFVSIHIPILSDLVASGDHVPGADGTSISGFSRTIRYSAAEEEDIINTAAQMLPQSPTGTITASAYVVRNLTTGEFLIGHNADQLVPVASLTKLVTAIVARKVTDPTERITVGRNVMATYGNTAEFQAGETFTANDLYYPLLMVSSNDAAEAFALAYGRKEFIQQMNDFVQSIGAYHSYFADASGLSPYNISSANDLALILDWIRKNDPHILEITMEKSRTIRAHTWVNPTHFLSWSTYLGGKNGYTPEADRTGALLFAHGSKKEVYSVVVLGSELRDQDVVTLLAKVR
ncbi:MAG: serine hydrolase [Patescibacteria group bacterium]